MKWSHFRSKRSSLFLGLFFLVFVPETSYAYLDPGSGNALVYLIISLAGAALYFVKSAYYRIVRVFSSKSTIDEKKNYPALLFLVRDLRIGLCLSHSLRSYLNAKSHFSTFRWMYGTRD